MKKQIQPVRMGIVGLHFGNMMVQEILKPEHSRYIRIDALCDKNEELVRSLAEKYGIQKVYTSLGQLLGDGELEAVGLFTGPDGRAKLIDSILDSGKDVLTTKPFERKSDEAERILKKARELGRVIHLNSPAPTLPEDLRQISEWIKLYRLGRPIAYQASVWSSYREKADGSWYDDPALCPVAPIFRLGIYLINDVSQIFGQVRDVHVYQSRVFTQRPTPDNAQLSILYEDGSIGNIFASFCVNDNRAYLYSLGMNFENGTIYRNCGADAEYGKISLELAAKDAEGHSVRQRKVLELRGGDYQYEQFCRAVRGERLENQITDDCIVNAIRIIEMMSRSE